jgi:trigger factor
MPTVLRENIGELTDKIIVKVHQDDYLPAFEKALKKYSKQANIPGFRKGMVPTGIIKKMHGSSVFAEEVIKSVQESLSNYMTTEKLEIFAQPLPLTDNATAPSLDMNKPAEYAFEFEVGLKPNFYLPDFTTLPLTRYNIAVTPEMLEEEVERLQKRNGKMTEPDTVKQDDTILNLQFAACNEQGDETEGGLKKDITLLVKYFSPNTKSQWMGKQKDEALIFQINAAFENKEKDFVLEELSLSAEEASQYFKATITKLGWVEKAPLDETLFQKAFPDNTAIDTEEAFKAAITADIQKQLNNYTKQHLLDQLYHALIEKTSITFPELFLKRWMQTNSEKPKTTEEVEAEFPNFVTSLKWTLILDRLAKENHIEVLPTELRALAKNQLLSYMGGQVMDTEQPWINDYIDRMMKDNKFVEDSYHRIQTDKALSWAETQTLPIETPISLEAFNELQKAHKH